MKNNYNVNYLTLDEVDFNLPLLNSDNVDYTEQLSEIPSHVDDYSMYQQPTSDDRLFNSNINYLNLSPQTTTGTSLIKSDKNYLDDLQQAPPPDFTHTLTPDNKIDTTYRKAELASVTDLTRSHFLRGIHGYDLKHKVQITSTKRTPEHNTKVGGVKHSAHLTGDAIDLTMGSYEENMRLYNYLKDNAEYDKLIFEYKIKNGKTISWIHFQGGEQNRRQAFTLKV